MNPIKTILIADRNPRILAYLKRELDSEGYCIHTVNNSERLQHFMNDHPTYDLLILDPDLISREEIDLLSVCRSANPQPIILHGLASDYLPCWDDVKSLHFVAKSGASVETLKKAIQKLLSSDSLPPG